MDTQLKKAFEETLEARIISTVPDMPDHRFSPQFERKMKRLEGGAYCSGVGGIVRKCCA